jgi:hypothetical protein
MKKKTKTTPPVNIPARLCIELGAPPRTSIARVLAEAAVRGFRVTSVGRDGTIEVLGHGEQCRIMPDDDDPEMVLGISYTGRPSLLGAIMRSGEFSACESYLADETGCVIEHVDAAGRGVA